MTDEQFKIAVESATKVVCASLTAGWIDVKGTVMEDAGDFLKSVYERGKAWVEPNRSMRKDDGAAVLCGQTIFGSGTCNLKAGHPGTCSSKPPPTEVMRLCTKRVPCLLLEGHEGSCVLRAIGSQAKCLSPMPEGSCLRSHGHDGPCQAQL